MKAPYIKPHLDISAQVALLQGRGMVFANVNRAERYLARIGYYRLSGYWYPCRDVQTVVGPTGQPTKQVTDNFRHGTTFEAALELYIFDKRLRLLLMDALERIEVSLRVEAALTLSVRSPFAHREPNHLHPRFSRALQPNGVTKHSEWLNRLDDITRRSREDFVKSFGEKYSSPLPIWIAIELWDFGLLSHFLAGMRHIDQQTLAAKYSIPRAELLTSWVRTMNHVRNVCAHHSRLWNRVSTELPKIPATGEVPILDHLRQHQQSWNRVYASLALCQFFMRLISPSSSWSIRLKRHVETFPLMPGASLQQAGFPKDWQKLPLWT